jgi:hypothetical protein
MPSEEPTASTDAGRDRRIRERERELAEAPQQQLCSGEIHILAGSPRNCTAMLIEVAKGPADRRRERAGRPGMCREMYRGRRSLRAPPVPARHDSGGTIGSHARERVRPPSGMTSSLLGLAQRGGAG